jgi:hypothetical protein
MGSRDSNVMAMRPFEPVISNPNRVTALQQSALLKNV